MRKDITKSDQAELLRLAQQGVGKSSIEELFHRAILAANSRMVPNPQLTRTEQDYMKQLGWTEEEFIHQRVIEAVGRHVDWRSESFVQRFIHQDLDAFAKRYLLYLRSISLRYSYSRQFCEIWDFLSAIGLNDSPLVRHLAFRLPYPAMDVSKDLNAMFNCVVSMARNEEDAGSTFPRSPRTKLQGWLRGVYDSLAGIVDDSPTLVSEGLEAFLKGYRRGFYLPFYGLIAFPALGLARLATNRNVNLSSFLDRRRPLPWDSEFHDWLQVNQIILTDQDLGHVPNFIADLFVRGSPPPWWSRVYATREEANKARTGQNDRRTE